MTLELFLTLVIGDWRSVFFARVLSVLNAIAPCPTVDLACEAMHRRAAAVITTVALEEEDPQRAADILSGAGGHETGFRTKHQVHGSAVTWWQLDGLHSDEEREHYLADDLAAGRRALEIARGCGGSMIGYASGGCRSKVPRVLEAASQLRACIESARRGGAWVCKTWSTLPKGKPKRSPAKTEKRTRKDSARSQR